MSLCVFTFNSFCRRPRAAQQRSTATPRFNTISNENPDTLPPPLPTTHRLSHPLCGSGDRLTTSELSEEKKRSLANFSTPSRPLPAPHSFSFPTSLSVFRLFLSLSASHFFSFSSRPSTPLSTPTVCPSRLHTDRNSEKLIFLRPLSPVYPAAPAPLFLPLALTRGFVSIADVYCSAAHSYGGEEGREPLAGRSGTTTGPSRVPSERAQSTNEQQ